MNIAVIAYRRSWMATTVLRGWTDDDNSNVTDLNQLSDQILTKTNGNTRVWAYSKLGDIGFDGNALIREAAQHINSQNIKIDKLVVTGFGPFDSLIRTDGLESYGKNSSVADAPFSGVPVLAIAQEIIGTDKGQCRLITDVVALATYHYWASVRPEQLGYGSADPHIVTAITIGRGIGGASVQKSGEIIGEHAHTELGHLPGTVHPDDLLFWSAPPRWSRLMLVWRFPRSSAHAATSSW